MDFYRILESGGSDLVPVDLDETLPDTSETVIVAPLALMKMLTHARNGVPLEVMGLLLGEFIDDYTVQIVDVFAMPQAGTTVTVESIDERYQTNMMENLKETGRTELVVGWYHSHPGFGCWLSSVDINTQKAFEGLNSRAVAIVVDPIQSVKGNVMIDAFRLMDVFSMMFGKEPRQTTSNIGSLEEPSLKALLHGLNRLYYALNMECRVNESERKMLVNLMNESLPERLELEDFDKHEAKNKEGVKNLIGLANKFIQAVDDKEQGKVITSLEDEEHDPELVQKAISRSVKDLMYRNVEQILKEMINNVVFKEL